MKRRPTPLFEQTSREIFKSLSDWADIVHRLRDIRLEKNEQIYLAAVGSKDKLPFLLRSRYASPYVKKLAETEKLNLFAYQRKYGHKNQHSVSGQFLVAQTAQEFIYLVLCITDSQSWRYGVLHLIDSLYPRAALPFLTQKETHLILRHVQRAIQPRGLRVLELSSKKRLPGTARKRFQSVREWTDADFDAVFAEAREENVWFRSVGFDIVDLKDNYISSTGTHTVLSKYGYFSCNQDFELFERTLVRDLIEFGAQKLAFFSDRERSTTVDHAPRPIKISYDSAIFKSSDQIRKLVDAMKKFKHGTCTVLHANPYMHVSMVDNLDYSSADVWVLSQGEILVVPQLRASASALKRIVHHLFENFREGEVSDVQEQPQQV